MLFLHRLCKSKAILNVQIKTERNPFKQSPVIPMGHQVAVKAVLGKREIEMG